PSEIKPETQAVVEQPKPQISIPKVQPVATKKTAPTVMPNTAKGSVRDPKTGEIASISSNYRFTKRWVKEALVAEGLLEKIYKNNELDTDTEAKIKDALVKLETMDKYRA
ncbi:MAG: hypothetical protein ACXWTS_10940, partial [Methylococcaceae bacterium]